MSTPYKIMSKSELLESKVIARSRLRGIALDYPFFILKDFLLEITNSFGLR